MNRLFKFATLFATVVSLSLLANDVSANGKVTQKQGTTNISSKLQKQQGTGQGVGSATPQTQPSLVYRVPAGGWKAQGGLFNQPTKPTFPYHIPPGGWKVQGGLFGNNTPPTNPPQPTRGTGMGHGFVGGSFGGGSFSGGTVTTTVATSTATVADPTAAPAQAATDSDSANAMQIAVGSTFTLKGEKFGDKAGRVGVIVGQILIPVEVTNWSDNAITITLPSIGVGAAAKATFIVERADGSKAQETNFEMVAAK